VSFVSFVSLCCTVARNRDHPLRDTLIGSSKGRDYRIESRSRQRFTAYFALKKRDTGTPFYFDARSIRQPCARGSMDA
jgi:hypothetical protein